MIVVVEDEGLLRELAVCELEDSGYKVVDFATADAALDYIGEHVGQTAAVVTDVQMPGKLNGLQLADIVSHNWPGISILVTSGGPLVDPRTLPDCARFLPKPWHPADMVERLRHLIGSRPDRDHGAAQPA